MPFNDEDFDFDDMSADDEKQMNERMKKEKELIEQNPLFLQAIEIENILEALLPIDRITMSDDEGHTVLLYNSVDLIKAKLFSALASRNYLICMQNAALIREHGEYLRLSNHHLKRLNFDESYVKLFREEMEKFRMLFIDWIKEVKKMDKDDFKDEWGMF